MSTWWPKIVCLSVKMPPPQQVKLAISCDIVRYSSYRERSYERPCLACDIWAVNRDIPVIIQGSIEVRHACRMAKNRGSTGENAVNINRQTCGIDRCLAHVVCNYRYLLCSSQLICKHCKASIYTARLMNEHWWMTIVPFRAGIIYKTPYYCLNS